MPPIDGTSVNVGRIGGGEGINMRAREAWFELDLRADDPGRSRALARDVDAIVRDGSANRSASSARCSGDRPAGRLDPSHPLVRAAGDALREAGIEVRPVATSTDANAAHARGIPAIAIGVTTGAGEHTPQEWIDTAPIADGVRMLARTVGAVRGAVGMSRPRVGRRAAGCLPAGGVRAAWSRGSSARLRPPVADGLVAARPELLRVPHARGEGLAAAASRHRRHEPAHPASRDHRGRRRDGGRDLGRPDDPGHRRGRPAAARARDEAQPARLPPGRDQRRSARSGPATHVTIEDRAFSLHDAHLRFAARADIPVYISASGPKTLELAGEIADGVILLVGLFPEALAWALEQVDRGAAKAGRPRPHVAVFAYGAIDDDEDRGAGVGALDRGVVPADRARRSASWRACRRALVDGRPRAVRRRGVPGGRGGRAAAAGRLRAVGGARRRRGARRASGSRPRSTPARTRSTSSRSGRRSACAPSGVRRGASPSRSETGHRSRSGLAGHRAAPRRVRARGRRGVRGRDDGLLGAPRPRRGGPGFVERMFPVGRRLRADAGGSGEGWCRGSSTGAGRGCITWPSRSRRSTTRSPTCERAGRRIDRSRERGPEAWARGSPSCTRRRSGGVLVELVESQTAAAEETGARDGVRRSARTERTTPTRSSPDGTTGAR